MTATSAADAPVAAAAKHRPAICYGAEVFLRMSSSWTARTEIAGRVFSQGGTRFHDLTLLPGVDFTWTEHLTVRPTGLINGTDTAMDWGIGLGLALSF